jgi:hypothetical protein
VKLPSQGGTSTFAGALKYLKEELSGGITVCLHYIAVAIVAKMVIIVMNGNYSNRTVLDFSTRSFFYLFLKKGVKVAKYAGNYPREPGWLLAAVL